MLTSTIVVIVAALSIWGLSIFALFRGYSRRCDAFKSAPRFMAASWILIGPIALAVEIIAHWRESRC